MTGGNFPAIGLFYWSGVVSRSMPSFFHLKGCGRLYACNSAVLLQVYCFKSFYLLRRQIRETLPLLALQPSLTPVSSIHLAVLRTIHHVENRRRDRDNSVFLHIINFLHFTTSTNESLRKSRVLCFEAFSHGGGKKRMPGCNKAKSSKFRVSSSFAFRFNILFWSCAFLLTDLYSFFDISHHY